MVIGLEVDEAVVQVEPLFIEYWYDVIDEPPVAPAVKPTESSASPAVIEEMLGALGVVRGVDVLPEVTAVPVPATFTALTRT